MLKIKPFLMNYVTSIVLLAICIIGIGMSGCQPTATTDVLYDEITRDSATQKYIQQQLPQYLQDTTWVSFFKGKNANNLSQKITALYQKNDNNLVWNSISPQGAKATLSAFVDILKEANNNGFDANDYQLNKIDSLTNYLYSPNQPEQIDQVEKMVELDVLLSQSVLAYANDLKNGRISGGYQWIIPQKSDVTVDELVKALENKDSFGQLFAEIEPAHKGYMGLKNKIADYQKIAEKGGWPSIKGNPRKGQTGEAVTALIERLKASGDLESTPNSFDNSVTEALKKYQTRHNFVVNGTVDAMTLKSLNQSVADKIKLMQLNMERYRWLPAADSMGSRYVWVNIPEFMMYVYDNGEQVADIVSVVGERKNATPVLIDKKMMNVIFSPVWNLPTNIAYEEMEYIIKNPAVLIVADIDVYLDGKKVDPRSVDWENVNKKRLKMKQKPKRTNSMGQAKFMFQNNYSIFLHDTPNQLDFKSRIRSASHGCVRVAEPRRLAVELLKGGNWKEGGIRKAMGSGKETYAKLPQDVRVHIYYLTSWVDDEGVLQFRKDIYGHDKRHFSALAKL